MPTTGRSSPGIIKPHPAVVNADALADAYRRRFAGARPTAIIRAPGRVNLIGEHVDYNDGLVLPIAIDRAVYAVVGLHSKRAVRAYTAALDKQTEFPLDDITPPNPPTWDAYVKGVAAGLLDAGSPLVGVNIYLDSDLPLGGGLSSSAALEVAVAMALLAAVAGAGDGPAYGDAMMPPIDLARLCRRAEHDYACVPCGVMDQLACLMSAADAATYIDCRDLHVTRIPWPDPGVAIAIVDTRAEHRLGESPYAERVAQCRSAVEQLRRAYPDLRSLRDVTMAQLTAQQAGMDRIVWRRARHVVTEIERTRAAAEALRRGDLHAFGEAMNESHESLRDDYEVSTPQLDELARALQTHPAVLGARMTGAGFGGCVVVLVERGRVGEVEQLLQERYDAQHPSPPRLIMTQPSRGAATTMLPRT